jgi:hypothetical protein
MKKLLLMILVIISLQVSAQQPENVLLSKRGRVILPEAGDFALGIAANPFVNFVGNMFNGNTDNNFYVGLLSGNYLYGKYFTSPQWAYRAKAYVSYSDSKSIHEIRNYEVELIFGFEKRRGESRFQFLYGPEFIAGTSGSRNKYFGYFQETEFYRTESNGTFYLGARGFAGAEYFIFPKFSIAAEMGFSIRGSLWGEYESLNSLNVDLTERRDVSFFRMNTDILDGQLMLLFHF